MTSVTKEKRIIILLSILLVAINGLVSNCQVQIISFWAFMAAVVVIMKFDFVHPYIWYLGMQTLYYTAYPILYVLGYNRTIEYTPEPMFLASIMTLILVVLFPGEHKSGKLKKSIELDTPFLKKIIHIFSGVALLTVVLIVINGYESKNEIYYGSAFGIFYRLVFFGALVYQNMGACLVSNTLAQDKRLDIKLILELGISVLLLTLFSGERDLIIRFLVVMIMILKFFNIIKTKTFIVLVLSFVVLIPLTKTVKYFFLTGELTGSLSLSSLGDLLSDFLSGEFTSASRNLQILVNNEETVKGVMGGKTFLSDIVRITGYAPFSANSWYQSTFFPNETVGKGFTLIGEGYINFGYVGVVIVGIVIGCLVRFLYLNHTKNIFFLYIYFTSIPTFIYANRSDLANIFAPMVRQVLSSAAVIYFAPIVWRLLMQIIQRWKTRWHSGKRQQ